MRPSWDSYFMALAQLVATRSTCPRANVGCVLVSDRQVVSVGYNGAPKGMPHCTDVGCLMINGHCVRTVHAEAAALLFAGKKAKGATFYVTHLPCRHCCGLIINAGVVRVVYGKRYGDAESLELLRKAGIDVEERGAETKCQ